MTQAAVSAIAGTVPLAVAGHVVASTVRALTPKEKERIRLKKQALLKQQRKNQSAFKTRRRGL